MRCLERNKTTFYYAPYMGSSPIQDENGYFTGETGISYGKPIAERASISAAKGETQIQQFGDLLEYDKVIVMDSALFDEFAVLWIDIMPVLEADGTTATPYDYTVKRIAKSLNVVAVAVKRVHVSGG